MCHSMKLWERLIEARLRQITSIDNTQYGFRPGNSTTEPISTYKFKRAFFRHDRRTAPKFGTYVRIETRLVLTKKIDQPHPRGV